MTDHTGRHKGRGPWQPGQAVGWVGSADPRVAQARAKVSGVFDAPGSAVGSQPGRAPSEGVKPLAPAGGLLPCPVEAAPAWGDWNWGPKAWYERI